MKFKHFQAPAVFRHFQGLEFRIKKFKYFEGLSGMRGNPEPRHTITEINTHYTIRLLALSSITPVSVDTSLGVQLLYYARY